MTETSTLQKVLGGMADFLEWVRDTFNDDEARKAIIADLGGNPEASGAKPVYPEPQLKSVKAYRDAADPDLESFLSAVQDIRAGIATLRSVVEAAGIGVFATVEELLRAVVDLMATNYVRLRHPRLYFGMQVANFGEETISVYGDVREQYGRFGRAGRKVLEFIIDPSWPDINLDENDARRLSEGTLFMLAPLFAFWKRLEADDVLYGYDVVPGLRSPTAVDSALARMLTLKFAKNISESSPDVAGADSLIVSLAWVPKSQGGPGMFVSLGGGFEADVAISKRWHLLTEVLTPSAVSFMVGPSSDLGAGAEGFRASIALEAEPDELTGVSYDFSPMRGTGVKFGRLRIEAKIERKAASNVASIKATFRDSALSLGPGAFDGFLSKLIPSDGLRAPFDFAIGVASDRGTFLEGVVPVLGSVGSSAAQPPAMAAAAPAPRLEPPPLPPLSNPDAGSPGLSVRIPIGKSLGPVTFHDLQVRLSQEGPPDDRAFLAETSTSLSATIGPVMARVDRIGIRLAVRLPENPSAANLGLFDLDFGIKTPDGVALAIDAKGFLTGGGFLFHDRTQHLYAGVFQVTLKERLTLKAVGFIATRLPDGSKGYSMLVFITAEDFRPIPLGMGFTLQGIGGLLAINRTFDEDAMREGLRNNTLANLLFPTDIIRKAPEILRSLTTIFPARVGSYLFGPLAKIGWASPTLVQMELALIFEFGARRRLIILGRISALLPSRQKDLVRLNMDSMGVIDFDQGTVSVDAVLVDSRLAQKFVLTGSMAARMRWTSGPGSGFAIAIGGFNPRFAPPVGMPKLDRITINLASGDNPRFLCEAYFAITPNTLQFGARANVYAAAHGFSVEGDVGFDVLVQLAPFHFIADFHASIQLKRGSRNLFKVSVAGELEGPRPLRVSAKASFEICWCDFSVRFDKTLIQGERPPLPPAIDVLGELKRALADERNWTVKLPAGEREAVSLRKSPPGAAMALHPLGNLMVRQTVVPLNTQRDVDQFGGAPLIGDRRFRITAVTLNEKGQDLHPVKDLFAPAQFFDMPDDEKLASPSFEEMDSGLLFGSDEIVIPNARAVDAPLEYESIVIDSNGVAVPAPPYPLPGHRLLAHASFAAVANAPARNTGVARFRDDRAPKAVTIQEARWLIVSVTDLKTPAAGAPKAATWSEARAALKTLNRASGAEATKWQLVPAHEVPA